MPSYLLQPCRRQRPALYARLTGSTNGPCGHHAPRAQAMLVAMLAGAIPTALSAQETETDASATMVQPLSITGAQPLEFGTVAIPTQGECIYEIDTAGRPVSPAGLCQFISADQFPARFSLNCAASTLVQFQLVYTDRAPVGAFFAAPPAAMDIDGNGAGALFQTRPCDTDGTSQITAAGRLTVRAATAHGFSGTVGTIRLEVAYD